MNYTANELVNIYYVNRDRFLDRQIIDAKYKEDNVLKILIENVSSVNLQNLPVEEGVVQIIKNNSINVALDIKDSVGKSNEKVCILSMGSYKNPGGAVEQGHNSQEENLYRCSDMSFIMTKHYYPLLPTHVIYTFNVDFMYNGNYSMLSKIRTFDVITAAAVKMGNETSLMQPFIKECARYMNSLIEGILIVPALYGVKHLVLGAFGCGAYGNDPAMVSGMFCEHLKKYSKLYKTVTFALVNDLNSVGDNVKVFTDALKSSNLVK